MRSSLRRLRRFGFGTEIARGHSRESDNRAWHWNAIAIPCDHVENQTVMSSPRLAHLPDFLSPPVIETVLGVSFPALPVGIPHYGLLWGAFRSEYPKFEVHGPIRFEPEQFGAQEAPEAVPAVQVVEQPEVRCWFLSKSGNHLVQVQRDGFLHNWRKVESEEPYPHYEQIRPIFERDWQILLEFLRREGLELPQVAQCEVTYVNHIERVGEWGDFGRLSNLFPNWCDRKHSFLPDPDAISFSTRFSMPDNRGRLRVAVRPAIRNTDGKPIFEFRLTARGAPGSSAIADILSWFDLGREWIVRGFADLTSPTAHKYWERTQ